MMAMPPKKNLSKRDYEFMHSLSAAVLQVTPRRSRIILFFWVFTVMTAIVWASFAQIDEIVRGEGEIIPSSENQMIQNLEGGIVEEILVNEGEHVEVGQLLVKIDNQKSESSFSSNEIKANALEARIIRLQAEASGRNFEVNASVRECMKELIANEESLYRTNMQQLNSKITTLKEQLVQRQQELSEAKTHKVHLKSSLAMITKEIRMTKPMVAKGVRSKVDFLKLQREGNEIEERYNAVDLSIPRLESAIKEVQSKIEESKFLFQSEAKSALNEAVAELRGIRATSTALEDQVKRTLVRSPMKGIVQTLYVHTVGGVIKPGADIVEIVPSDQTLLVEVKIKPSDIAFIYYGQKAIAKFSAYDFSIYGGLEGKVVHISADTITDQNDNTFYTIRIKTDKNYIGDESKPLKIIPGMTVNVDIITGKKSVMDYILKPILKTKQYTFTER
ncbi:HlyD family type I secretion periplasmic adaptor subunit [Sulfurimonas sp. HSL3-7]|uniref:HlyD family type I secretion periplasmic adaptor subunit n=1 Tax=Sulfonitrofixus jiaomeiensis TaxID=3131938 RepID=UPI0031FA32AB